MINIQNLNFGYSKKQALYEGLHYKAKPGSIIGLLGKNGAGKSTLLQLIAGLLKPQKQSIEVMGQIPFQRKPSLLEQVYFLPEEPHTPTISMQVYAKAMAPLYPNFDFKKLDSLLDKFELNKQQKLQKVSLGQRKKFIIAFALSTNCKLLLLDEPTNGLDIPSKALFRKVMAGALTDQQLAIISTHQVKDVENLIDRLMVIDNGNVIFDNSTYDISQSISFTSSPTLEGSEFLYHEPSVEGFRGIKNQIGSDTAIDIELLFNAVTNGTKLEIHESDI